MYIKNKALSKEKTSKISADFKKALVTGAIFASVAMGGLSLTGCGKSSDVSNDISRGCTYYSHYNTNENIKFTTFAEIDKAGDRASGVAYVLDESTNLVYLVYNGYHAGGLSPAYVVDEETNQVRPMMRSDLEKILESENDLEHENDLEQEKD